MKLISCHDGKLHALDASERTGGVAGKAFCTGLAALDELLPGGAFARGALHELLAAPGDANPMLPAAMLARRVSASAVIWSDPTGELYPPALAALGIPLERLFLLHPTTDDDQVWAVAECLRCRGVGVVVAALPARRRFSRVEARRLQLAAERGGGVGLLIRESGKGSAEHAAVTRWLVQPATGERHIQRWKIQLVFGHGGRVGQSIILEHYRDADPRASRIEAHPVHPAAELANRPGVPPATRVTA